ncbi:mannosyltransferase [Aestuariivivens sediminis]|uniref:mannosyltransferase n=1 Tax=Aestuariivivens sediminis TaxID=2913557 RepID=UPI001F57987D|nr:mannosyltransferase [Aestuariivivens sediminis]
MRLNLGFHHNYKTSFVLVLASALFYFAFAYHMMRTEYVKLIVLYSVLFFSFYRLVALFKNHTKILTYLAFGFRAIFILAIPNLSQDFYRFIWDGRMILEGFNPYVHTVLSFIEKGEFPVFQAQELFAGMGRLNASHFSNYPPVNQWCFVLAATLANKSIMGSVMVMRLLIIGADFGTLHFGKKLLDKLQRPNHVMFWYMLNPFIIIELTGNLHFEGLMIFFLVWSMYLLHRGKWAWAAVILALSISVKLIPLIFLPLFFQWFVFSKNDIDLSKQAHHDKTWNTTALNWTKLVSFYAIVILTTLLLFVPFYSTHLITTYLDTVALWFSDFEFNASLYYIARAIGYTFRGYNEIAVIGPFIPFVVLTFTLILTFFRRNLTLVQLITSMLFVLSFYYFTSTTVHPWYIASLLILSVFTSYKFPLVWSFVIILSYLAYLNSNSDDKSENLWVIGLEYLIVYSVFIWEIFIKKASRLEA